MLAFRSLASLAGVLSFAATRREIIHGQISHEYRTVNFCVLNSIRAKFPHRAYIHTKLIISSARHYVNSYKLHPPAGRSVNQDPARPPAAYTANMHSICIMLMRQPINARAGKYVLVQKHKIGANYCLELFPRQADAERCIFFFCHLFNRAGSRRQAGDKGSRVHLSRAIHAFAP